ncbi:type VI secretion system tip protein TssI/VgrG [Trinickia caryophylli]|uniref:Type VI secretion system secreted protein VgrG n=1 Tax=Trinickia caryophylli TaxID=28094 RepID=A0A1X7GPS4_TRICW|nr:type VI secretion system tip protein TssI/VgrG [Trinickia caryophylli]PMS10506.1 type VI secretion system tip protein VgrG [Trinickia caryophylli]TRX19100.1 type VI secretion system tip protein VgrG [Trinickia caryophylli]WQE10099.1 type VI secretion system tip protein TssI/VgrG [Trinickia caryophylli]SMF72745.1 type VI secretion system secreted protein VgrG [Trinickia caryophylli]GLU35118.1 type IV secretion protein Rhs [Trinickia caryophylli]
MVIRPAAPAAPKYSDIVDAIHRGIIQRDRLLKLDTPLGADVLIPLRAQGWAKLGRDYRWTVDAVSIRKDVELLSLMHQPVTLWLQQTTSAPFAPSTYRPIHGFVHRVGILGADGALAVYQLEFASALFFLGHTRNDYYWLEKSARHIVLGVLARYPQLGGRVRLNIRSEPRVRSYCRQAESDLNFLHRLLEDEGWYFYWEHATNKSGKPAGTTLVIVDCVDALPEAKEVVYHRANTDDEVDGISQWVAMQRLQSLRYTSRSFDYMRPDFEFEVSSKMEATTYTVQHWRHSDQHEIPAAPMEVYEALPYGYPSSAAGYARALLRTEAWEAQARRYTGTGALRWADAGSRFVLNKHPRHVDVSARDREFLVVESRWYVENNVPIGRHADAFPHSLQRSIADAKAAHGAHFASKPHPVDGEAGFFVVEFEAQVATVEYRSPFEHGKPVMHIEHALAVAPTNEEVWADEFNRVLVRFVWDRQTARGVETSSPLLLSLQADTGNGYGAVHVPRAGEWLAIGYWGGDCDRPFILGRLGGGTTPPPWHTHALLSGFKSRGFGHTGAYNAFIHDDATNQGGTRLTSYTGKSYSVFHQGYLIGQQGNTRGRYLGMGFMLHTDDYGAVRANGGLYVSTYSKQYDSEQLDVEELHDQLTRTEMLVEALSNASATAQAEPLRASQDVLAGLKAATRRSASGDTSGGRTAGGGGGAANSFVSPLIALASPAGIALSTQQSAQIAADRHVSVGSGENTSVAAGKSLILAAAEKLSVFVQQAGMKLFAAKGKVELAAQSDEMRLTADRDLTLTSSRGRVVIEAKDELMFKCGGSYIRITADGIEDGTRGARAVKSASFSRQGPSSVAEHMNRMPTANFNDPYVLRDRVTGEVLKHHPYELVRADGTRLTGMTDDLGQVPEQKSENVESIVLRALRRKANAGDTSV